MSACTVWIVPLQQMKRLLHEQHPLNERFLAHVLARNGRLEADLVDQGFNNSERLARTLLMLARYGNPDGPRHVLPKMSQEVLAEIVGTTTRSRINMFMNKFRKLGSIEYNGDIVGHRALLSVALHDTPPSES